MADSGAARLAHRNGDCQVSESVMDRCNALTLPKRHANEGSLVASKSSDSRSLDSRSSENRGKGNNSVRALRKLVRDRADHSKALQAEMGRKSGQKLDSTKEKKNAISGAKSPGSGAQSAEVSPIQADSVVKPSEPMAAYLPATSGHGPESLQDAFEAPEPKYTPLCIFSPAKPNNKRTAGFGPEVGCARASPSQDAHSRGHVLTTMEIARIEAPLPISEDDVSQNDSRTTLPQALAVLQAAIGGTWVPELSQMHSSKISRQSGDEAKLQAARLGEAVKDAEREIERLAAQLQASADEVSTVQQERARAVASLSSEVSALRASLADAEAQVAVQRNWGLSSVIALHGSAMGFFLFGLVMAMYIYVFGSDLLKFLPSPSAVDR